ncbi:MAG: GAF domain-containing protein [Cyclobacteriaceae bacterium]|nr:GAF domain-containing protein [Cyclobacteriaceae bacterium]
MKLNLKNPTIRERIYFIIFLFLLSALFSGAILHYLHNNTKKTLSQLSAVHHLQNQVVLINEHFNTIFERNIFDSKEELINLEKEINTNISSILYGGNTTYFTEKINPLTGNESKDFKEVDSVWKTCSSNLTIIQNLPQKMDSSFNEDRVILMNDSTTQRISITKTILVNNSKMKEAIKIASSSVDKLRKVNEKVLNNIIIKIEDSYSTYNISFLVLGVINIFIFGFSYIWIKTKVVKPIQSVGKQAQLVAKGDINARIDYTNNDEIGTITSAINVMATYLQNSSEFVHQIGEGNLESNFQGVNATEINKTSLAHALISMRDKLKAITNKDEKRNWATQGVAKFANIIRNNNSNIEKLSSVIMSSIVEYLNTNQGCMYILNKDETDTPYLSLSAYYAFNIEKFHKEKILLGEGLVGQTFLERKTTYLLEIPEEYMKLKSGLGSINPHAILIVPLIVNDEAFGVIELASFNEIESYKIEFIEQLGEMIASAISNVRNNENTQLLLDNAQKLTERMKSQEEEMRQYILEDLSTSSENDTENNQHNQMIVSALETTFATAELSIETNVINANIELLKYTGYNNVEDLIGQNISQLIVSHNKENLPIDYFSDLKNGKIIQGVFYINKVLLNIVMTPAKSMDKGYDRVLFFAHPADNIPPSTNEKNLSDLEEELQQNVESLQLTEEVILNKINYFNIIDEAMGIGLIEELEIIFATQALKNTFNELAVSNQISSLNKILDTDSITKIKEAIINGVEINISVTNTKNDELKLKVIPIKGSKQTIIISYK